MRRIIFIRVLANTEPRTGRKLQATLTGPLSRSQAVENHRCTQINTDENHSEPRFLKPRIHAPKSDLNQRETWPEPGPQNLCSSASICGWLESLRLNRPRARTAAPAVRIRHTQGTAASASVLPPGPWRQRAGPGRAPPRVRASSAKPAPSRKIGRAHV